MLISFFQAGYYGPKGVRIIAQSIRKEIHDFYVEYVESLESRIENVEKTSNTLAAMCKDKTTQKNTIDVELETIMASMVNFHITLFWSNWTAQ